MKNLLIILLIIVGIGTAQAQGNSQENQKPSTPSPDFPGSLIFEYGLNYLINPTHEMRTNPWKSATINVYYMYPIQLGDSRFSVNPGIGVGSEKFGFEDDVTLFDSVKYTLLKNISDLPHFANVGNVSQTQLVANYIDFPLEFRVHLRKDDHKRSWFLGVGGKIGVNFDAKTKIKYSEYGNSKTFKDKYHFNINSFRYGFIARIGIGPFSAWYYYSGSDLFRGNKAVNMINPSMWSFGLSLATF